MIALAISSNIGAGATLIGNPQNMMIGQVAHLDFGRYMVWSIVPVVFAMAAAYGIIWLMSRKNLRRRRPSKMRPAQQSYPFNRPHTVKGIIILLVAVGLFFTSIPKEVIALAAAGIHLASTRFRTEDCSGWWNGRSWSCSSGCLSSPARFNPPATATRPSTGWRRAGSISTRRSAWP